MQQELTALGKRSCVSQNKVLPLKTPRRCRSAMSTRRCNSAPVSTPCPCSAGGTPQLTKTLDNAGQPTAVKTVENRLGPFLHLPTRPLPTLPKRVLFEDGGAYAAAELEAAQPSGTAD